MRMKKGQAAMEFLTTYGWAIMVVLIAIGTLSYFGVMNTEKYFPESCVTAAGFGCVESAASAEDQAILLGIKNNLAEDITSATVTLESPECGISVRDFTNVINGDRLVDPASGESAFAVFGCPGLESGKTRGTITIEYKKSADDVTHTVEGEFQLWASKETAIVGNLCPFSCIANRDCNSNCASHPNCPVDPDCDGICPYSCKSPVGGGLTGMAIKGHPIEPVDPIGPKPLPCDFRCNTDLDCNPCSIIRK